MSEYINYNLLFSDAETNTEIFGSKFIDEIENIKKVDVVGIIVASLTAGMSAFLTRSSEPLYQVGVMAVSQLVSDSIHNTLLDLQYLKHDKNDYMGIAHVALLSTGLFSLINYQFHYERNYMLSLKNGLLSSLSGAAVSNYLKPKMEA